MLLLRSALAVAGAVYIVGKFVVQSAGKRRVKAKRVRGHAYRVVDELPLYGSSETTFPHPDYRADHKECDDKIQAFLATHIVYPRVALQKEMSGTAVIAFDVEIDGTMTGMHISRDPGHGLGKAAFGLVCRMAVEGEKWRPGYLDGATVRTQFSVPVEFSLRP